MITLEEIIIQNSLAKEAKLYGPSKKAMENPSNGITIQIPAAVNVIKDCATLANQYIPHYVFGVMGNPFTILNKKLSIDQIRDFVNRASTDLVTYQLLRLILDKGKDLVTLPSNQQSSDDPYGDYGSDKPIQAQVHDDIYSLSKLFGII
jgi:hypothetical protein